MSLAVRIAAVLSLREKLFDRAVMFYKVTLAGDDLREMTNALVRELPPGVQVAAVFDSLGYLAGRELTEELLRELAWRLAGNVPQLQAGRPVRPWASQTVDEWVPLQIIRGVPGRNRKDEYGFNYTFRVLAGTPCPMAIAKFWPAKVLPFAAKHFGFSQRQLRGKYPYTDPLQLVGLRIKAKIETKLSTDRPRFFETRCNGSLLEYNRDLLRLRFRVGDRCPRDYTHPCHQCVIGFSECPAGTHFHTYTRGFCESCGKDSVFDPAEEGRECVPCLTRRRSRRRNTPPGQAPSQ